MVEDAELYELIHRGTPGDIAFYRKICEKAQSVLELGSGTGRVAAALSRVGHLVTALELDEAALRLGRERHAALANLTFVSADMTGFALGTSFDVVIVPFGSLYCLLDVESLLSCLNRIRAHLKPRGVLAFDAYAGDSLRLERESSEDEPELLVTIEQFGDIIDVFESSVHMPASQRVDATYEYRGRAGTVRQSLVVRQRYLYSDQVEPLLRSAGFGLTLLAGDFSGGAMTPDSEQLVVVAHKLAHPR